MKAVRFPVALSLAGFFVLLLGCSMAAKSKVVPGGDAFYEKTNVLFTDQEHRIFARLKDPASREKFIEDFWKVRDFNPSTEANEAKEAFEQRMETASRLFSPRMAGKNVPLGEVTKADWGWNTEAGRIFVLLGPPDAARTMESFGESDDAPVYLTPGVLNKSSIDRFDANAMRWSYSGFGLEVAVSRTQSGDWQSSGTGIGSLRDSMDFCRLHYGWTSFKGGEKPHLQFSSEYDDGAIRLRFPVSRVAFAEDSTLKKTRIKVLVNVYRDLERVDSFEREIAREESAAALNNIQELRAEIAYRPESPGKYLLDVVAWDLQSETPMPFREIKLVKIR